MKTASSYYPWKKLGLVGLTLIVGLGLLLGACREEPTIYRVGFLAGLDSFNPTIEAFKEAMTNLGYVEGENIVYDFQAAKGDGTKMQEIADQFARDKVDLIVTTTTGAAQAAVTATAETDIPVIFTIVIAPEQVGVVENLRHPGGHVTGIRHPNDVTAGKRLEFLLQMAPQVKRVWVPYDRNYPTGQIVLDYLHRALPAFEVELIETPIQTAQEVPQELAARATTPGFDAIFMMPDPTVQSPESWQAILAYASEHNLPISGNTTIQPHQGALYSYTSDLGETGRMAALLADKILHGENVANIPVETADAQLVINYQVAKALGLKLDNSILAQAKEIIR